MLLFLGAIPPPLGGVSVYCARKIELLSKFDVPFRHFDSRKNTSIINLIIFSWFLILSRKEFKIEINVSNPLVLFLLIISGISKFCVFFDHNGSRRLVKSKVKKAIFTEFYKNCLKIKVVNENLRVNYEESSQAKISVQGPFLPPSSLEVKLAEESFPSQFTYLLEKNRNIVLTSAWKAISTDEEHDLYGILDSLDIYKKLLEIYKGHIFVLMVGELDSSSFSQLVEKEVIELSKFENFVFIAGGYSQLPLLPRTKALLRLTKTDGDSVSVREALYFGANVIATKVGLRPEETILIDFPSKENALNELHKILSEK